VRASDVIMEDDPQPLLSLCSDRAGAPLANAVCEPPHPKALAQSAPFPC